MKSNKLLSALLILILLLTPTTAVWAKDVELNTVSATAAFTPRLSAPSKSNSYYYSSKNIFYSIGLGIPNCTAYAWGRAYEILKSKPKLSVDSAHYWYNYNKTNKYYPYGQTPKIGAIACWNNPYGGHVAVVEKIENGVVTLSNSAYNQIEFYTSTFPVGDKAAGQYGSGWSFYGYIYILDAATAEPTTGDVYRITSSDGVNLRKNAGTNNSVVGVIPYNAEITVTEYKSDTYLWGKTSYNGQSGWCVLDYAKLIKDNPTPALPSEKPPAATTPAVPETTTSAIEPTEVTTAPVLETDPQEETTAAMTEPSTASPTPSESAPPLFEGVKPTVTEPTFAPVITTFPEDLDLGMLVTPESIGDANGDGNVNVKDAILIQKYLAKAGVSEADIDISQADVNLDGVITVVDATCIQKIVAKII